MAAKRYAIIHQAGVIVAPRPGSAPAKPDPSVSVGAFNSAVEPSTLSITIPTYDPAAFNSVLEIHALQLPSGQSVPSDPIAALALNCPRGSADVSAIQGQTFDLPIPGMIATAAGSEDTLVVIAGYDN
jgi:hypothetical protein